MEAKGTLRSSVLSSPFAADHCRVDISLAEQREKEKTGEKGERRGRRKKTRSRPMVERGIDKRRRRSLFSLA